MAPLTQVLLIVALFSIVGELRGVAESIDKLTKEHFLSRQNKDKEK